MLFAFSCIIFPTGLNAEYKVTPPQERALKIAHRILEQFAKNSSKEQYKPHQKVESLQGVAELLKQKKFVEVDQHFDVLDKNIRILPDQHRPYDLFSDLIKDKELYTSLLEQWRVTTGSSYSYALSGANSIDLAWSYRGSSVASKVTKKGWKSFAQYLAEAKKFADQALKINPSNSLALRSQITISMGNEEGFKVTESYFQDAIRKDPGNPFYFSAAVTAALPRWSGSINTYLAFFEKYGEQLQPSQISFTLTMNFLAESTGFAGNDVKYRTVLASEKYRAVFDKLLKIMCRYQPNSSDPYFKIGELFKNYRAKTLAIEMITNGLAKFPEGGKLHFLRAQILFKEDKLQEALKAAQLGIKYEPNHGMIYYEEAKCYNELRNTRQASESFEKALMHLSTHQRYKRAFAGYYAGKYYLKKEKFKKAGQLAKLGLMNNHKHLLSELYIIVGKVALHDGDKITAKKHFQKSVDVEARFEKRLNKHHPGWQKW